MHPLITVQHLLTLPNKKLGFVWLAKKGQFDVVEIMMNDQFNFDLTISTSWKIGKYVRLLGSRDREYM